MVVPVVRVKLPKSPDRHTIEVVLLPYSSVATQGAAPPKLALAAESREREEEGKEEGEGGEGAGEAGQGGWEGGG